MKFSSTILLSIFTALTSKVAADCTYVSGNYYCDEVSAVVYNNVGYSGSYSDVTNMDESSCECTQESVSFEGTNSPLDEELSVHFRGPLKLLQFGVYYPSSSSSVSKRDESNDSLVEEDCSTTKHVHHVHKRDPATQVVEITETVYVNANGQLITNSASTTSTTSQSVQTASLVNAAQVIESSSTKDTSSTTTLTTSSSTSTSTSTSSSTTKSSSSTESSASATSTSTSSSAWNRVSYYTPGSTTNVTFLNTLGGSAGSGTWSSCFGNSLSYLAANGVDSTSAATALDEVTIGSDTEYVIFSGSSCSDSSVGDCGYYRTNIPAYHGFGGSEKIFVFEFEMPHETASSSASNPDMPAIWLLNAKIPRTLQYGSSSCSCWSTGCGELDLFEILSESSEKLISHIHDGQGDNGSTYGGGGSQDYFVRPTSSSLKAAVIFNSDKSIHIVQLDDSTSFSSGLDSTTVSSWLSKTGGSATLS
ncbi:hypothetical protein WICMUC_002584 [Wickerhamomyces mucosus]|uniref:glucan endo-1,3-beta-D-glucosidase n=1 Tax=Wickerhamomyces mucosus TaxID=1378264 RepID=A0A9P8PPG2_9ASCO|nr:hypothetical protein WICMUC_002584 [Wickerhamomyces mucosus]